MKKSLLTFLAAILMMGCFTSCLENEIPDEVTAIYEQQSNVLAAQAMMIQAEADKKKADAALVSAEISLVNAQVEAQIVANTIALATSASDKALAEAQLAILVAEALQTAELAKIALLEAQAELDATLAALAQEVLALNDENLAKYFELYENSLGDLSDIQSDLIEAQFEKLEVTAMIADDILNNNAALADFALVITDAEAEIATLELAIIDLKASIAVGTTNGDNRARLAALEAEVVAIGEEFKVLILAFNDKDIENDAAQAAVAALSVTLTGLNEEYADAVIDFNGATALVVAKNLEVEANLEAIVATDLLVESYDADKEAMETASEEAATAVTETEAAEEAALEAEAEAKLDFTTQDDALTTLVDAEATADTDLNDASNLYTNKLNEDSGDFQATVDAATVVLNAAELEFNLATDVYDTDPTGRTYVDAGRDGEMGDHSDDDEEAIFPDGDGGFATMDQSKTFAEIATIVGNGSGEEGEGNAKNLSQTATFESARLSALNPATQEGVDGRVLGQFISEDDDLIGQESDINKFSNIELDDVIPAKNVDRYNASVDALQIARIELANAEENLADYDTILADLKTILDDAQDLFENAEALVAAQTAVVEAALDAEMAATLAVTAAEDASAAAVVANAAAIGVAEDFPSEQELIDESAQLAVDNQQIAIDVAELALDVADIEVKIAKILALIENGKTPELIAAEEVADTVGAELAAINSELDMNLFDRQIAERLIATLQFVIFGPLTPEFEVQDIVDVVKLQIASNEESIEDALALIALAKLNIENTGTTMDLDVAYAALFMVGIDGEIAALQSQGEFYSALVAKYKALVDSLL